MKSPTSAPSFQGNDYENYDYDYDYNDYDYDYYYDPESYMECEDNLITEELPSTLNRRRLLKAPSWLSTTPIITMLPPRVSRISSVTEENLSVKIYLRLSFFSKYFGLRGLIN